MKKNKYTPEEFAAAVGTSLERLEQLKAEKILVPSKGFIHDYYSVDDVARFNEGNCFSHMEIESYLIKQAKSGKTKYFYSEINEHLKNCGCYVADKTMICKTITNLQIQEKQKSKDEVEELVVTPVFTAILARKDCVTVSINPSFQQVEKFGLK